MTTDDRPWQTAEDAAVALALLGERDEHARVVSSVDGRWVLAEQNRLHETAPAAYAAGLMEHDIYAEGWDGHCPYVSATIDGRIIALQEQHFPDGTTGMRVVPESDLPRSPLAPSHAHSVLVDAVGTLHLPGFVPAIGPLALSDLADAMQDRLQPDSVREYELVAGVRRRSSFPFHEAEAFRSTGALADADAVDAVRHIRAALETCDVILAERWAQLISVEMSHETALAPEPSPTNGMAFSAASHQLADWLQLAPAELSAGSGNLVILGRRFAHDSQLIELSDGELASAHPVTEDPWFLWLFDDGVVRQFRLRSSAPTTLSS
jgi:hypothetical protein